MMRTANERTSLKRLKPFYNSGTRRTQVMKRMIGWTIIVIGVLCLPSLGWRFALEANSHTKPLKQSQEQAPVKTQPVSDDPQTQTSPQDQDKELTVQAAP